MIKTHSVQSSQEHQSSISISIDFNFFLVFQKTSETKMIAKSLLENLEK